MTAGALAEDAALLDGPAFFESPEGQITSGPSVRETIAALVAADRRAGMLRARSEGLERRAVAPVAVARSSIGRRTSSGARRTRTSSASAGDDGSGEPGEGDRPGDGEGPGRVEALSAGASLARRTRRAQGLPAKIEDPTALASAALLVKGAA